jgi:hypothetical protein
MATPPNMYKLAVASTSGVKPEALTQEEQDLLNLNPAQLHYKYGQSKADQLLQAYSGALQDTYLDLSNDASTLSRIGDFGLNVGIGGVNTIGGLGALGASAFSPEFGQEMARSTQELSASIGKFQSENAQDKARYYGARGQILKENNRAQYERDIANGSSTMRAGLNRIGRDIVDSIENATQSSETLTAGTGQGVGSLLGGVGIAASLRKIGSAALGTEVVLTGRAAGAASGDILGGLGSGAVNLTSKELALSLGRYGANAAVWPTAVGLMEAGGAYSGTVNEAAQVPLEVLRQQDTYKQNFDAFLAEGLSPTEADREAITATIQEAGTSAALKQGVVGAGIGMIAPWAATPFATTGLKNTASNIFLREPIEEALQGGSSQYYQNRALQQNIDNSRDMLEGVGEQIGTGALYGLTSTGTIQGPSLAVQSALATADTVGAGVETVASAFGNRGERVISDIEATSPVSNEAVSAKIQAAKAEIPQVYANVAATTVPEEKSNVDDVFSSIEQALTFSDKDIQELDPTLQASLVGSKDRIEVIDRLLTETNNTDPEKFEAAMLALATVLQPIREIQNKDISSITGSMDEKAASFVHGVKNTFNEILQTPTARLALDVLDQANQQQLNQSAELTVDDLATPAGQAKARGMAALAAERPDIGNIKSINTILNHADDGLIDLTKSQIASLKVSRAIIDAKAKLLAEREATGNKSVQDVVTEEIVYNESGKKQESHPSALIHARRIVDAYRSGDFDLTVKLMEDFGFFVDHMTNKANAFKTHYANGSPKRKQEYLALMPNRALDEIPVWKGAEAYVNTGSVKSVGVAQAAMTEQRILAQVFNGLVDAFPDMGQKKREEVAIPSSLEGSPESIVAAHAKGMPDPRVNQTAPVEAVVEPVAQTQVAPETEQAVPEPAPVNTVPQNILDRITRMSVEQLEAGITRFNKRIDSRKQAKEPEDANEQAILSALQEELSKKQITEVLEEVEQTTTETAPEPVATTPAVETTFVAAQDRSALPSEAEMDLASRKKKLAMTLDYMSDGEIESLYNRMGLAGKNLTPEEKLSVLKQESPDDTEAAMRAKPEAAKPEVSDNTTVTDDAPVSQVVLQNRNRSDAAYVQQMTQISANPDATRLGFSRDFSAGAPVILADGIPSSQMGRVDRAATGAGRQIRVQYAVVEAADLLASNAADGTKVPGYDTGIAGKSRAVAGNGRVAGLKSAYQKGTAGQYREDIAGDEALHGVSASVIRGMKAPILVRIMSPADVTANIGDESNDSGVSQKSAIEHAKDDARRIDVAGLEFGEDGEVTKATMRQFVASMPVSEQTGMLTAGGEPTTQATNRLMGAIFWQAYQSEGLTELFSQATDPEARTVLQGLAIAAPAMARLKDIAGHDLDIRDLITEAAVATVNARRRNIRLSEYINQLDLDASPEIAPILRMFAENIRSSKKIGESLQGAAEFAYDEATRDTSGGMFGDAVPAATRNQVLGKIHDTARQENLGQQGRTGADGGNAQGQAANTRAEGDRAEAEGNQQERLSAQKTEWLTSLAQTLLRNGRTTERDFVSDDGQEYTVKATESTGRLTTAQYDGWKRAVGLANSAMPVNEELLNVSITLTGIKSVFTGLVEHTTNYFYKAFSLRNTKNEQAPTKIFGEESPLAYVRDILLNEAEFANETGRDRVIDSKLSNAFSRLLDIRQTLGRQTAGGILAQLEKQLSAALGSKNKEGITVAERWETGTEANRWTSGKILNIAQKNADGSYSYHPALIESAVLAGMSWFMQAKNIQNMNMEDTQLADLFGVAVEGITDDMRVFVSLGNNVASTKLMLAAKIKQYWGLQSNSNIPDAYTEGIPEAVAGEILEAMEALGMILERKFDGDVKKEVTNIIVNTELSEPVAAFPSAIDKLVLVNPEQEYTFNQDMPYVPKVQHNNGGVPLTKKQLKATRRASRATYKINMPMLNIYLGLSRDVFIEAFGHGKLNPRTTNKNHLISLEGYNSQVANTFDAIQTLSMEINAVSGHARKFQDVTMRFGHTISRAGRMMMLGAFNPQANKIMREMVLASESTLDLVNNVDDITSYNIALGQAFGIKVHFESPSKTELEVSVLSVKLQPAIEIIQKWLSENNTEDNNPFTQSTSALDVLAVKQIMVEAGITFNALSLHAVMDMARFTNATTQERQNFTTKLYVEADGVTNGPFNAIQLYSTEYFTKHYIRMSKKGGLSIGSKKSLAELNIERDTYTESSNFTSDLIKKLALSVSKQKSKHYTLPQINALLSVMNLLSKDVTYDPKSGVLELKRGISKNPLTVFVYGASPTGIAGAITNMLKDALYERLSQEAQGIPFPEKEQFIRELNLLTNRVFKNERRGAYTEAVKQPTWITDMDPVTFTLTASQSKALMENVHSIFVNPMVDSIEQIMGRDVLSGVKLIQQATNIQSALYAALYKEQIEVTVMLKSEEDADYQPSDYISRDDRKEIEESLSYIAPLVRSEEQTLYMAKSEQNPDSAPRYSRTLSERFRQTSVRLPAPIGVGVSQG